MPAARHPEEFAHTRDAIAALYETHFERVARYIAVRIGEPDEAQDLASEVFVRALRSAESYRATGAPLEAWVFRIAHNIVVDHLRSRSRRPASVPIEDAPPIAAEGSPAAVAERKEEIAQVRAAMSQLSQAQQRVLALRFGAELSSEDAAQALGKNPGAVREMQSAAIKKLRKILQRNEPGRNKAYHG